MFYYKRFIFIVSYNVIFIFIHNKLNLIISISLIINNIILTLFNYLILLALACLSSNIFSYLDSVSLNFATYFSSVSNSSRVV